MKKMLIAVMLVLTLSVPCFAVDIVTDYTIVFSYKITPEVISADVQALIDEGWQPWGHLNNFGEGQPWSQAMVKLSGDIS